MNANLCRELLSNLRQYADTDDMRQRLDTTLELSDDALCKVARDSHLVLQCGLNQKLRNARSAVPRSFRAELMKHQMKPPPMAMESWKALHDWFLGTYTDLHTYE